VIFPQR